ncbi:MAG: MFS transporter [Xanthomonadales bacterium]|nr:MFS transporter [Xanthomonadales bacterium]
MNDSLQNSAGGAWQRRHTVVLLCFLSTFICYIDRVNISIAIIPMAKQFGWSDTERGLVLSSFFAGYMVTQVMGGWLAQKWGGKAVLGFGVVWWSVFTMLTPLSALTSFPVLIATRIAMGLGEGVAFPSVYHMFGRWVPANERSRAASFNLAAIPLGTLTAIIITPWLAVNYGWESVFYVFGVVGVIWYFFWRKLVTDTPAQDSRMSQSESRLFQQEEKQSDSEPIPWKQILTQKPVWAIIIMHFCSNWGLYVLLSWLPSYFSSQLGIGLRSVWIYVAPPWLAMFIMGNVVGIIADRMIDSGWSVTRVRRFMQFIGSSGPALALIALASVDDATTAVVYLTLAMALSSFAFAGFASNHLDIAPRHAGVIFGISNTAGTLPGIIGVALTGLIVETTGSYASAFYLTAAMYALGLVVWQLYSTGEKILD